MMMNSSLVVTRPINTVTFHINISKNVTIMAYIAKCVNNLKQPITHCVFRKLNTVKHLSIGNKISDIPRFSDIIWVTKFVIKSRLYHCNYPLLTSI